MVKNDSGHLEKVGEAYYQGASGYDRFVNRFDIFARLGFNISGWRKLAVSTLTLKPGDTVVDLGCGTGLNFSLLQQAVSPSGRIIGLDLSEAMLAQAGQTVQANNWKNVELVWADAAQFQFPPRVDGVLSTYTLILVPECRRVVDNVCAALVPGGRLAVLDMAWPSYWPLWWRHVLFFLASYGVTAEVLRRRPWKEVQTAMKTQLADFCLRSFWFGFFYLASGSRFRN